MLRALCFLLLAFIGQMVAAHNHCIVCLKDTNMCVLWFLECVSNPRWDKSAWCQVLSTEEAVLACTHPVTMPGSLSIAQYSQPSLLKIFQGGWKWNSLEGKYYFFYSFTCVRVFMCVSEHGSILSNAYILHIVTAEVHAFSGIRVWNLIFKHGFQAYWFKKIISSPKFSM